MPSKGAATICPFPHEQNLFTFLNQDLKFSRAHLKRHGIRKEGTSVSREFSISMDVLNFLQVHPVYVGPEVGIIQEDEHLIFLNKPARVHCHPLNYSEQDNLLSFLRGSGHWAPLTIAKDQHEKGLLHRIDYETQGIVALAKNQKAHEHWRSLWGSDKVKKIYRAQVHGRLEGPLSLCHQLDLAGKKVKECAQGVSASILVDPLGHDKEEGTTHVSIHLREGHRHQIRVQLSLAGHPLWGDPLYGRGESGDLALLHHELILDNRYHITSPSQNYRPGAQTKI